MCVNNVFVHMVSDVLFIGYIEVSCDNTANSCSGLSFGISHLFDITSTAYSR